MYCDHTSCKKEVDINSVAVSQAKNAITMFNDDGLGMTRFGGGNDRIVNVCKSCGHSEYLYESIEHRDLEIKMEIERREFDIEMAKVAKKRRIIFWILFPLISFGLFATMIIVASIFMSNGLDIWESLF